MTKFFVSACRRTLALKAFKPGNTVFGGGSFLGGGAFLPQEILAGDHFFQGFFTGSCFVASETAVYAATA